MGTLNLRFACLYSLNKFNHELRKLIRFCRIWLNAHILEPNAPPGMNFSNFLITMLIVGFLQQSNRLPPISQLSKFNYNITDENMIHTYVSSLEPIKFEVLLMEFFEFIASFEYRNYGYSVLNAKIVVKPEHKPVYIENPFERDHNCAKNITVNELEKLMRSAEHSYNLLNTNCNDNFRNVSLADLIEPFSANYNNFVSRRNRRLNLTGNQQKLR